MTPAEILATLVELEQIVAGAQKLITALTPAVGELVANSRPTLPDDGTSYPTPTVK